MQNFFARLKTFWGGGNWVDSSLPGNRSGYRSYWLPGTRINWDAVTGEFWQNAAALACFVWKWKNFNQAPPLVQQKNAEGQWETIPNHPLPIWLRQPNPFYDGTMLLWGILLSLEADGNAYVKIERTLGQRAAELYWLPHCTVEPHTEPSSKNLIDWYEYTDPSRMRHQIAMEDVLHIRFGLDPNDCRKGFSAWRAVLTRQGFTLNQGVTYDANVLRNGGVASMFVTPADGSVGFEDPDRVKKLIREETTQDNVAGIVVLDGAAKIEQPGFSPSELALGEMLDRPEADVSAVFGVPAQVAGLHVGRLSKTYANVQEAREIAWEETLIPLLSLVYSQMGAKLLPPLPVSDDSPLRSESKKKIPETRLWYDLSQIRPLQPDKDALHTRVREDWKANLIDRAEWKRQVGLTPLPEDKDVYYRDVGGGLEVSEPTAPKPTSRNPGKISREKSEIDRTDFAARVMAELEALPAESVE